MIEEIENAWMVAHGEFPKCELCEEYIQDEAQEALVKAKTGYKPAHKQCVHQLTLGIWDELEARALVNIPQDAPYDVAHTADPKVRKSLGLDTQKWDRAMTAARLLTGGQDETTPDDMAARIEHAMNKTVRS